MWSLRRFNRDMLWTGVVNDCLFIDGGVEVCKLLMNIVDSSGTTVLVTFEIVEHVEIGFVD
jgi:hypothetical protein